MIGAFELADGDAVAALHEGVDAPIVRADVASAEMIKLAANAALMTRISFINEIANVCEQRAPTSCKVAEGIEATAGSARASSAPGSASAASYFPKDSMALKQLAANSGYHFQVLNAVIEVNELQKRRVIGKLTERLGLRGKRVALLGLAFKPNTDDTREAPAFVLAGRLLAEGADVVTWDPIASSDGLYRVEQATSVEEAARGADAVILVTRVAAARGRRLARRRRDYEGAHLRRRPQHARSGGDARRRVHVRRDRARRLDHRLMEAIVLAGGKAERLGDATGGLPKSLVPVGGRPLLAWQIGHLQRRRRAGDRRCAAGRRTRSSRASATCTWRSWRQEPGGSAAAAASASPWASP